ncbi:hypothetical protein B0H10DRAFT_1946262 [Mycena sp. CBHHK59/15]|nr:hypothetical protein B0H10DRAFT_1946262 [Mycena sp. CBHHK59/15]
MPGFGLEGLPNQIRQAAALSNVQVPTAAISGGTITVTWESTSSDTTPFTIALYSTDPSYNGPFAIANNVNPQDNKATLAFPEVIPRSKSKSASAFASSHVVFPSISMSTTGISMHSAPSSASSARTIHFSASAAPSASAPASSAAHPASSFLSSAVSGARPASPSTGAAGAPRVPAFGLGLGLGAAVALGGLVVGTWAL